MTSFTNGALVFRVWPDGSGELMAKFQYKAHAESFAKSMAQGDAAQRDDCTHLYVAVCDAENFMKGYQVKRSPQENASE
jgi:hypothetical protein